MREETVAQSSKSSPFERRDPSLSLLRDGGDLRGGSKRNFFENVQPPTAFFETADAWESLKS
jgi:hypothetical protein